MPILAQEIVRRTEVFDVVAGEDVVQRSEQTGGRFGTKERSYRAVAFENAIGLFEGDAASLVTKGYRVSDAAWERSESR